MLSRILGTRHSRSCITQRDGKPCVHDSKTIHVVSVVLLGKVVDTVFKCVRVEMNLAVTEEAGLIRLGAHCLQLAGTECPGKAELRK